MRTESSSHTYAKLPALLMLPTAPGEPDSDTTMPFPVATSKLYLPSFSITRSSLRMGTCSLLSSKRACPCSDSYWGAAKTPTTTRESTAWNEKLGDVSVVGSSRMNHYDIMKRNGYWRLNVSLFFFFQGTATQQIKPYVLHSMFLFACECFPVTIFSFQYQELLTNFILRRSKANWYGYHVTQVLYTPFADPGCQLHLNRSTFPFYFLFSCHRGQHLSPCLLVPFHQAFLSKAPVALLFIIS